MALFKMQERDLDLFLLEELHSNKDFARWFAEYLDLGGFVLKNIEHSVSAKFDARWGETDVLAYFSKESEVVAVLIEDKIAANFADRQAARYHERASDLVTNGKADRYVTVLIAPNSYLVGAKDDGWQNFLPMEIVRDWFSQQHTPHAAWREAALTACLSRLERTRRTTNVEVLQFSKLFADFLRTQPGSFSHSPTDDIWGFNVSWPERQKNVYLTWKLNLNRVDLTFSSPHVGKAKNIAILPGVKIRWASDKLRSDILTIEVPQVDLSAPLHNETDVLTAVMAALYEFAAVAHAVLTQSDGGERRAQ